MSCCSAKKASKAASAGFIMFPLLEVSVGKKAGAKAIPGLVAACWSDRRPLRCNAIKILPKMTQSLSDRLIKKYPNRRLYDTRHSVYITLSEVKELVRAQEAFTVVDARSGEDITRSILLQIIVEEEGKEAPLLSAALMSQLICCYGSAMQDVMGTYL